MKDFLKTIITKAGAISLDYRANLSSLDVRRKSPNDLVSDADIAVEQYLISQITDRFPRHAIHGEESGDIDGDEYRWVIDPIDGTTSFVHNQPYYSVSIALEKNHRTILAAVYAPVMGELFMAELEKGATLNDKPIGVSPTSDIADSIMATGFACIRFNRTPNNLPFFNELVKRLRDIRRYGSAALDLCYTACGRLEGFWELNLQIHDVAAGFLILTEAGGKCGDFSGSTQNLYREVLGTNAALHPQLCELFSSIKNRLTDHHTTQKG